MDEKEQIEIWLPIDGFCGYDVSNFGRVRSWWSHNRIKNRFFEQPKIRKLVPNLRGGYLTVMFTNNGKYALKYVHHLVLKAFKGEKLPNQEARHLDGNVKNNFITNLAWGSSSENTQDQIKHGTDTRGERNGGAKLTNVQVDEIRQRIESGEEARSLVKIFNVSDATISRIKHGIRYKN